MRSNLLQQIHIGLNANGFEPVAEHRTDTSVYVQEHEKYQEAMLRACPAQIWPKSCNSSASPRPLLVGKHHLQQVHELHEALVVAVTDIVQRWWSDKEARFPERMPLEAHEEDLLQWIEGLRLRGKFPEYSKCRGSWRPDFLVERLSNNGNEDVEENFRITEINARFAFNGYFVEAHGQRALDDMGIAQHGLESATSSERLISGLLGIFQPDLPLHLLKGDEYGMDIHMFMHAIKQRLGVAPQLITPKDLRLVPDESGKMGYRLCCVVSVSDSERLLASQSPTFLTSDGELVQEIHQVGLELHQHELRGLDTEMLKQISLRCFNDMRTIMLVHDKRMLGLVKQELAPLVKRKVLTPEQARILDKGIADTILPGSPDVHVLLNKSRRSPELKSEFLLKPIRGGKGTGILFGEDLGPDEWVAALEGMRSPGLNDKVTYVIQRRITPRLYNVVLRSTGEMTRFPLVGTYHILHGEFLGIGVWRSSGDRICAISYGGAWLCSVMTRN